MGKISNERGTWRHTKIIYIFLLVLCFFSLSFVTDTHLCNKQGHETKRILCLTHSSFPLFSSHFVLASSSHIQDNNYERYDLQVVISRAGKERGQRGIYIMTNKGAEMRFSRNMGQREYIRIFFLQVGRLTNTKDIHSKDGK